MDLKKWELIVLEWVNCLKLSDPMKCLNNLRNGIFFSSLVQLLMPDATTSSETCLMAIVNFLRKQYPNFLFQYESDFNLEDLLEMDLLIITSLLLHYSCIYDRRDVLTSPLCHKLSKTTQICIRAFLENIKTDTTKEKFFETIEQCTDKTMKPKILHALTLPSDSSPKTCHSPLQDLLQTPPLKLFRLQEKDREISNLRSEIDLERFEKIDLQDELHVQKERNKKLSKQMNDKTSEIIRLRSEIMDLENKSLPQEDSESCELQQRLRSEISSLEQYIAQLQNEQDQLYTERDAIKNTLRKVEGQYTIWHDKAISSERDFDNLLEKHQQQEAELWNLRAHCTELSALLDELRSLKRCNDSTVEVDTSVVETGPQNLETCEDLACAVVEVQLRDAQKENAELKNILKESQENAKKLCKDLSAAKASLDKFQTDYEILEADNNDLLEKVSVLTETQAALQTTRRELDQLAQTICELSTCKVYLTSEISTLQQQFSETKMALETVESLNDSLSNNLKLLQDNYDNLQATFMDKNNTCSVLEQQMSIMQTEYDELLENYNKTNFNLQGLTKNFHQIEYNMEQSLLKLERFVFGANGGVDLKDLGAAFTQIFSQLENNHKQQNDEKKVLIDRVSDFEELTVTLKSDLNALNEREVLNLQERQTLYNNLKCAEQKRLLLESTVSSHITKIDNMNSTISEMSSTIAELELLKQIVEQKESVISAVETTNRSLELKLKNSDEELAHSKTYQEDLQRSLESLERIKNDFEVKIAELEKQSLESMKKEEKLGKTIAELQALTCVFEGQILRKTDELDKCKKNEENLHQSIEDLKYQLFEANNKISRQKSKEELLQRTSFEHERQFQETIQVLNVQIDGYQTKINELEMHLQSSKLNCAAARKDLDIVTDAKQLLQEEVQTCRNDFRKRCTVLELTIKNLERDLQCAVQQESNLQEQLNLKVKECQAVRQETDQNISQHAALERKFEETLEALKLKREECLERDDLVSKTNQDLLVLKLEVEERKEHLRILEENISQSTAKIIALEEHTTTLNIQNRELRQQVNELQGECSLLHNLKESLEKKCEELESNAWKIVTELSLKNEQLDDLVKQYKMHQEKTEADVRYLETCLAKSNCELEQLEETKSNLVLENKKEIENLQGDIAKLNKMIESLNSREVQYVDEIRSVKNELTDTIDKFTEALQARQEIEAESETQVNNLTENLHELIEKYNNLDKSYADSILKLSTAQEQVDILENDKIQLEVSLLEHEAKYEEECSSSANLHLQISNLTQRELELKNELQEKALKLEVAEKTNDNFKNVSDDLSQLKKDKLYLCQKLNNFGIVCKDLKSAFVTLKLDHKQFVDENCRNLTELQSELLHKIGNLISENASLEGSATKLEENVKVLQNELAVLRVAHSSTLEQKDADKKTLVNELDMCKEHINTMCLEKRQVEEHISLERAKLVECKKEFSKYTDTSRIQIEEYKANIVKLKCANSILETGKEILQKEIATLADKIHEIEEAKLADEKSFVKEMEARDEEIKNSSIKIDSLQAQVLENVNKNDKLILELCSINESLDSLTKQHCKLQEVLKEEQENYADKVLQIEAEGINRQTILENLQSENQHLNQELFLAKNEVEGLKGNLKAHLMERQALELEIRAANEKLLGQDSLVRQQESAIAEANAKLLGKLEEILEVEKAKRTLQEKVEGLSMELDRAKRSRDEIMETQTKLLKDTENNLIRAHENATDAKNDLMKRLELAENEKMCEKQLRCDIERLLEGEKVAKEILEIRVMELNNEKCKFSQLLAVLKHNIECLACVLSEKPVEIRVGDSQDVYMSDLECLNQNIGAIRERILEVMQQNRASIREISDLEKQKSEVEYRIEQAINEKVAIADEKEQLFNNYNILCNEKAEREQDFQQFKDIQITHDILKAKYEQLVEFSKNSESVNVKNGELEQKITDLERKTSETYSTYKKFAGHSITYKIAIEKLITERNVLECVLSKLKQNLASLQIKIPYISDEREHARVTEQAQAFEVIVDDIQKQFLRISRKVHEIILMVVQIPVSVYDTVVSDKMVISEELFEKVNFDEELEKIADCRDRTNDLLVQIVTFEGSVTKHKMIKPLKENILRSSNNVNANIKVMDEELKKKNTMLKQRLTLAENARSNLEKKVKQLRQENKTLNEKVDVVSVDDFGYKTLLRQHIQTKEEYEKTLNEYKAQYSKLLQEHEDYKAKQKFIPDQIKYEKEMKTEHDVKLEKEIIKLREAYGNLMSDNSKLDLENATMRKLLEDRTTQLSELKLIKEAYEKLLEENNKLRMELDTMKYKRNRDREALYEALKKDQNEGQRVQDVRSEYEAKLEKMKDKMIQLYREEINREMQKHQKDQNEKVVLIQTIEQLQYNLNEMKLERSKSEQNSESRDFESYNPRDSFFLVPDSSQSRKHTNTHQATKLPARCLDDLVNDRSSLTRRKGLEDRKCATLPKSAAMSVIEEGTVLKHNTLSSVPSALGQNLEMEDEEDDPFNNKYLADLKEGRCNLPTGGDCNASRLSELKWRNSLCPPHLKSSYPAETQFSSPGRFKDEELKSGTTEFDDSMSTRLIPGEKPRKKDIGTTSYKKPGPPTPSKNGGRVSLQGNEAHLRDALREHNESKTPKRTTPSRLKALFMGRNSSVRDNSENQPGTPRSKRLSIFRKPK